MANAEPTRQPPKSSWEHFALYERVVEALRAAPAFFATSMKWTRTL